MHKIKSYPARSAANLWGWSSLWHGGIAQATATAVGHWPWFVVYNYLNAYLPWDDADTHMGKRLVRNAGIGLAASIVSDVSSNGIRVLKTYRQTSKVPVNYWGAFSAIRAKHGLWGWEVRSWRLAIKHHQCAAACDQLTSPARGSGLLFPRAPDAASFARHQQRRLHRVLEVLPVRVGGQVGRPGAPHVPCLGDGHGGFWFMSISCMPGRPSRGGATWA